MDVMSSISLGRTKGCNFPHPCPDGIVEGIEGALFPPSPQLVRAGDDPVHSYLGTQAALCNRNYPSKLRIVIGVTRVLQCAP
jgi:hypothetical protein